MSDLDKKLKEIRIKRGNCNHLLFHEDIKAIKQSFKEEGYRPPMQMYDRGDGVKYSDPVMTGREWYDRYIKELEGKSFPFEGQDLYVVKCIYMCKEAAKRAAGLTDE